MPLLHIGHADAVEEVELLHEGLVHVPYGTVSINGSKLATRTGNVVLLKDLFAQAVEKARTITLEKNPNIENPDEIATAVGVGAIVFHYLSNNRMRDINFVLEDALSFDGNTGPYAQYTYARTASILAKANEGGSMGAYEMVEAETALCKTLSTFPETVNAAIAEYEPSYITRYILELCAAFNRFYHDCQILSCTDATARSARIAMTQAVHTVLGRALSLICMKTTEKI